MSGRAIWQCNNKMYRYLWISFVRVGSGWGLWQQGDLAGVSLVLYVISARAWQAACGSLVKADIICCLPFFLGLQCVRESTTAPVWELASCLPPPPHGLGLSKHPALACCASNRIQIEPDILLCMEYEDSPSRPNPHVSASEALPFAVSNRPNLAVAHRCFGVSK